MLYNINDDMFYKYITELYENKEISNNEYKAGLNFLLYKDILSSVYLIDNVLTSYINILLPTSEKDWRNIIADDIEINRTKQNSILVKRIIRKIIEEFYNWNELAKMINDYENKNNYFNRVFNKMEITGKKRKYIINEILNNTNYDMFYSISLNKYNAFNEFYTLLAMFKKYKKIDINKTDINRTNINKISINKINIKKIARDSEY